MKTNEEVLALVYERSPRIEYEQHDGIVTVLERQDHWTQQAMRKFGARIPQYKRMELDPFGSFVFLHVDGQNTVERIGELLDEEYGEQAHPLYERLLLFLNHINVNSKYIQIKQESKA